MSSATRQIDKKILGSRIAQGLKDKKIRKGTLAKLIKRDKTRISQYLKGEDLTLDVVAQIATVLGCSIDYLVGRAQSPTEIVAETPELYGDEKRLRLVREVKALAQAAKSDVIDALLKNVEVYKQVPANEKS